MRFLTALLIHKIFNDAHKENLMVSVTYLASSIRGLGPNTAVLGWTRHRGERHAVLRTCDRDSYFDPFQEQVIIPDSDTIGVVCDVISIESDLQTFRSKLIRPDIQVYSRMLQLVSDRGVKC